MDNSTRGDLPLSDEQVKKTVRPWIKFGVLAAAIGIGSYYGAGRHIVKLHKDVKKIVDSTDFIGRTIVEIADERAAIQNSQRKAITDLIRAGKGFTHFPGVGVLDHEIFNELKTRSN